jgi:uncharacterized delta-60 repeat protein
MRKRTVITIETHELTIIRRSFDDDRQSRESHSPAREEPAGDKQMIKRGIKSFLKKRSENMKSIKAILSAVLFIAAAQLTISAAWGDPDPSFGTNGKFQETTTRWTPYGINVRPDGTIYVSGYRTHIDGTRRLLLRRYLDNGQPDLTFGTVTDPAVGSTGLFIALVSGGKIVVSGHDDAGCRIWRFNSNGTPDSSFGVSGSVQFVNYLSCQDVAVQNDKLIASGYRYPDLNDDLIRLNADGSLDTTFGISGVVNTSIRHLRHIKIDTNDRILVGGNDVESGTQTGISWGRFTSNGGVDPLFSTADPAPTCVSFGDLARQSSGRLLIHCTRFEAPTSAILYRYTTNGVWDGYNSTTPGNALFMSIQKNGKVVVGTEDRFVRFSDQLEYEEAFSLSADQLTLDINYRRVGLQPSGKVVFVGLQNNRLTLYRTLAS